MSLLKSIESKYWLIFFFFILFVVTEWLIFTYQLPYRLYNSDIFHQLAVIKEFGVGSKLGDPFFGNGPTDLHAGPYYYAIYLITALLGVSTYNVLAVVIGFNVLFLAASLYFFARSFDLDNKESAIFILISIVGWGSFTFFFAGIYEYTNLLVSGSFPSTIGVALLVLALGVAKRYIDSPNWTYFILSTVLTCSLLLSHVLSGVVLVSFLGLLVVEHFFRVRRIDIAIMGVGLSVILAVVASFFVWPPFSLLDLFSQSTSTVEAGASTKVTKNYFDVPSWPTLLGMTSLGAIFLPLLFKKKQYFFFGLTLFSAIMTASYLLPVRVSLYWRYFPFLFLGLSVALAIGVQKLSPKLKTVLIVVLLVLGVHNIWDKFNLLLKYPIADGSQLSKVASVIPSDSVVLSDPNTAYHLAAYYPVRVVSVPYNHANPAYIKEGKKRYEETMDILEHSNDKTKQAEFLARYKVNYVVINKEYYPDYILLGQDRSWLEDFQLHVKNTEVMKDGQYEVYKL